MKGRIKGFITFPCNLHCFKRKFSLTIVALKLQLSAKAIFLWQTQESFCDTVQTIHAGIVSVNKRGLFSEKSELGVCGSKAIYGNEALLF